MSDDFWDKFSSEEEHVDAPPPQKSTRLYVGGLIALFVIAFGAVGLLGLFPFQYEDNQVSVPPPPPPAEVAQIEGTSSPALDAVTNILKDQFTDTNGLVHASVGEEQIARTLPGQNGCASIAPVASGLQGYSGGDWLNPVGITITVNAYGPGLGATALSQLTEDCKGVSASEDSPGVVTGTIQGSPFRAWHHGDVVISVTATNTSIPSGLIEEVNTRVSENLKNVCVAPVTDGASLSARNPYYDADAFTGLMVSEEVHAEAPSAKMEQPVTEPLPDVTRPSPPEAPYYPASLPAVVDKPDIPQVPEYPAISKSVAYQVEDPEGPGCGWSFTGTQAPIFDADKAETDHQTKVSTARKEMADAFTQYDTDVQTWMNAWIAFEPKERAYRDYATQVDDVAIQWDAQKEAQDTYADDLDDYNDAVDRRERFLEDQRNAQTAYDADVQTCNDIAALPTPTPTPTPTPSPSATPTDGSTPTASPSATPTPTPTPTVPQMQCPPDRPAILDQDAPTVPVKPTPPPDPRPEGER